LRMRTKIIAVAAVIAIIVAAYVLSRPPEIVNLKIATTTSLNDTGLLDALKAQFSKENPYINVTWVAVGTGQAIEIGKRGDVDLVLVHSRTLEDQFINGSYGVHGITIAWNDYVILGSQDDPANATSANSAIEAFKAIYDAGSSGQALFVSRADGSGTNVKEKDLWKKAKVNATGEAWYIESGSGMAATLRMANEKQAYTLSDRATYLALRDEQGFDLTICFEGDGKNLLNTYRAILVNPDMFPNLHYKEAEKYVLFLVSSEGQQLIDGYTKNGQKLFNSAFGKLDQLGINDPYEDNEVAYWTAKLQG
jgi:tungstate transport system substrate-binding protein